MGIDLHRFKITSPDAIKSTQRHVDNDELPINIPVTATKAIRDVALGTTGGSALETMIRVAVKLFGDSVGVTTEALAGAGVGDKGGRTAGVTAGLAVIIDAIQKHAEKAKKVLSKRY